MVNCVMVIITSMIMVANSTMHIRAGEPSSGKFVPPGWPLRSRAYLVHRPFAGVMQRSYSLFMSLGSAFVGLLRLPPRPFVSASNIGAGQ